MDWLNLIWWQLSGYTDIDFYYDDVDDLVTDELVEADLSTGKICVKVTRPLSGAFYGIEDKYEFTVQKDVEFNVIWAYGTVDGRTLALGWHEPPQQDSITMILTDEDVIEEEVAPVVVDPN